MSESAPRCVLALLLLASLLSRRAQAARCNSACTKPGDADWLRGYATIGLAKVAAAARNESYAGPQCMHYVTWPFQLGEGMNVTAADEQARAWFAADRDKYNGADGTSLVETDNDVILNPPDPGNRLCLSYMAFYYCAIAFPHCSQCAKTNPEDGLCKFVCEEKLRRCGSVCSCDGTCAAGVNVTTGTGRCYLLDHSCSNQPTKDCSHATQRASGSGGALLLLALACCVALGRR